MSEAHSVTAIIKKNAEEIMSQETTLEQVAECTHKAEIICALIESYPHQLVDSEISALTTLLKRLFGNVVGWLINELAERGIDKKCVV